jgi:erythronate-4-phosphate dehydrogenase
MKPGSILMNTSRGGVVDTNALSDALARKHLGAVVLDVFENEPAIDTALLSLITLGTPHIAGYSYDGKVNGTRMLYHATCEFFKTPASWSPGTDLPKPRQGSIQISDPSPNVERTIRSIVRQCYDIEEDDRKLRQIADLPQDDRGRFFQRLRAEYIVRREFMASTVVLESEDRRLREILSMLGFPQEIRQGKPAEAPKE